VHCSAPVVGHGAGAGAIVASLTVVAVNAPSTRTLLMAAVGWSASASCLSSGDQVRSTALGGQLFASPSGSVAMTMVLRRPVRRSRVMSSTRYRLLIT
jgi:hypothetical protein